MSWFILILLSLVEGLTEFLPVSSTGHLILTSSFFNLESDHFITQFNIIIQFGAILSVLVLYWRRFLPQKNETIVSFRDFYLKLFVAMLPAGILGILVKNKIDALLESPFVVCLALISGGIILLFMDDKPNHSKLSKKIENLKLKEAFYIGLFQCIAFIPGFSRSAATIIGGRAMKLSQKEATEFSFFLAVPTLTGAALLKTLKILPTIQPVQVNDLLIGTGLSFIFALVAIKTFINLVSKGRVFRWFGLYRIILGLLVLVLRYF